MHARVVTYRLKPFTLIGATTRAGLLSAALRSRFGISHRLDFYPANELVTMLKRAAGRLDMKVPPTAVLEALAKRSRGTPRICLRLLRRARDFAAVRRDGRLDEQVVNDALALEGIDAQGLDALDRAYLRTLNDIYEGGPAGLEALAATLGEDPTTLEDVVEPFLLQQGLLARTRQGRLLTPSGRAWMADGGAEPQFSN
jgi:Holliday junction DNA helicase RuvB